MERVQRRQEDQVEEADSNLRGDKETQLCPRINRAQPLKSEQDRILWCYQPKKPGAYCGISRIPWATMAAQPQSGLWPPDMQA